MKQQPHIGCAITVLLFCLGTIGSAQDWPMFGGTGKRNNAPSMVMVETDFDVGKYDRRTGLWSDQSNIKWTVRLGSQSYSTPVVADGRVFIGTNNGAGYLPRFPATVDLGVLLCFRESDGAFLWQHSNEKLPTGRVHDWPQQGICSTPTVEGDRLWYVNNRGEVVCLDTAGFRDGEDDGPVVNEWVRLFQVDGFRHTSLDRRHVLPEMRAQFAAAGIRLEGRHQVRKDKDGSSWTIFNWVKARAKVEPWQPVARIVLAQGNLHGYELDAAGQRIATMRLFTLEDRLLPDLEERKLGPLRQRLIELGYTLPEEVKLEEGKGGWCFATDVEGVHREFRLQVDELGRVDTSTRLSITDQQEADVVWKLDMMKELGVRQHNMANCSPAIWGDLLFIGTSNGVDEAHLAAPKPDAPSFIALDKRTGKLLWSDNSPGENILHGQWSSPAVAVLGGVPQVLFAGGDGWLYSFRADRWDEEEKRPFLLWKFDANPKTSKWMLGGRGTRNNIITMPVIHDGLVYFGVGQDPEHGEGEGHLWCIAPTKRGDVSAELAKRRVRGMAEPIPHRRLQAVDEARGEFAVANPNSAVVWHYTHVPATDGEDKFHATFHRTLSCPVIKNGLLIIPDFSGLVHCLDAKTGRAHWTCDLFAMCWSSPLIVGDDVLIGDEDGDLAFFRLSANPREATRSKPGDKNADREPLREINVENTCYSTPVAANGVLYLAHRTHLFAIAPEPAK